MAKNYQLVDLNKTTTVVHDKPILTETDWKICILCQEQTTEGLVYPDGRNNKGSGYDSLSENMIQFHNLGSVPLNINIARLSDGSGISETMKKNHAGWHKSCWLLFCNMKLQRAEKRAQKRKQEAEDNPSPVKTRGRRGSTECSRTLCFFCDKIDGNEPLHSAATENLDATVRECATELRDTKLLAKLAAGDMVALDAVYHLTCLTKLRNRMRDSKIQLKKPGSSADALVFGELVGYIEESLQDEAIIPVFKLSELVRMYATRLTELGEHDPEHDKVHATRLKERLLRQIPDLRAEQQVRDVLLIFRKDIGDAIKRALDCDMDKESISLVRAAQIVRKHIFSHKYEFHGSFEHDCERDAVPPSLNALVRMIMEGPTIENQSHANTTKEHIAAVITQVLLFNTVKKSNPSVGTRHNRDREVPLPIYLSLLIHANTRSKQLIDTLYDRVMSISTDLANTVCAKYHANQIVCPPQLNNGVFTCGAFDNIDHNPSARTAHDSFHGTAISLMQFPTEVEHTEHEEMMIDPDVMNKKTIAPLPVVYTMVPPVAKTQEPIVPVRYGVFDVDSTKISDDLAKEKQCLEHMQALLNESQLGVDDYISWAAYHASQQPAMDEYISKIALLPLFRENAHTTCMVSHAMNMVKLAVHILNPQQVPVIAADQPLYAVAKQVQWSWPEINGEDKFIIMMGGLHIEMNLLKLLGDWLQGSGWTAALVQANITTSGRADSMLAGSHVTRTRYAHQVTAAALYILQNRAFQQYLTQMHDGDNAVSFEEWCVMQRTKQPQFKYWELTLQLELIVLQFVRSFRERNFTMYVQCLLQIVPWLFALDHTNYCRWLPVHISDMVNLPNNHPEIYRQFNKGHFAVQKTKNVFSAMAIEQCHEQVNELIKGDGGAVGLTENPQALERWMVAGPEISRVILEFEKSFQAANDREKSHKHHEQYPSVQNKFAKEVRALVSAFDDLGNPYLEDSGNLFSLDTKMIVGKDVIHTVYNVEEIGKGQYRSFMAERLKNPENKHLSDIVKKNKLPLFNTPHEKTKSKSKLQFATLKTNCTLFARLYIACQARQGNLDTFFEHENQPSPPSISDMGQLRQGSKSDVLDCITKDSPPVQHVPDVGAKILDGAAIIHMLKPTGSRTFQDYAQQIFIPYLLSQLESVDRVDIVWDRYLQDSLKQSTRERRMSSGTSQRQRVLENAPIPPNWESFLRIEQNKDEMFHYLAECIRSCDASGKILLSTQDENVITAGDYKLDDIERLQPCTHEEADTRILLHVAHCAKRGIMKVAIRTVDSDVVIISVGHFHDFHIEELWISFGVGNHFRQIPIHEIANSLQAEKSKAMLMFHAISGCDTVSSFLGKGKKSAWSAWTACPAVTDAFTTLSSQPEEVDPQSMTELERFIIIMYSRTCTLSRVDEARKQLFTQGSATIENIPPTKAALFQHVKRAVYQAGHVWSQALVPAPHLPSPELWGWTATDSGWKPFWTDRPDASKSCYELVHCGCKKGCKRQCKCHKSGLQCTELCSCRGACGDT